MTNTNTRFAIVSAVSRSIVYVLDAPSSDAALEGAAASLDRTRVPAAWSATPVDKLPPDLHELARAWRPVEAT